MSNIVICSLLNKTLKELKTTIFYSNYEIFLKNSTLELLNLFGVFQFKNSIHNHIFQGNQI